MKDAFCSPLIKFNYYVKYFCFHSHHPHITLQTLIRISWSWILLMYSHYNLRLIAAHGHYRPIGFITQLSQAQLEMASLT